MTIAILVLAITFSLYFTVKVGSFLKSNDLIMREVELEKRESLVREAEYKQKSRWQEYLDTKNQVISLKNELQAANKTAVYQANEIDRLRAKNKILQDELESFQILHNNDKLLRKVV